MEDKKIIEYFLSMGNDNGNSEHDIIIDGVVIQQPNVTAKIRNLPMLDEINIKYVAENIHDNLLATVTTSAAEVGIYFSGKLALKSGEKIRNIDVGADNSKLDSDVIVINTLERIAAHCVNRAYLDGEDLNKIEIVARPDMTTALPVTQYTKKNSDAFSEKFMKSEHIAIVHVGTIDVKVTIKFGFVKTLPESVPATFALQSMKLIEKPSDRELTKEEIEHNNRVNELFKELNSELTEKAKKVGKKHEFIDGRFFEEKRILHVGIGEGTTEYPLTDDITFDPNFIRGSDNGIGHAIDRALPEFKKRLGLRNYSRQNYSEVLRDPSHKYHDIATEIVEQYIDEEAKEILPRVKEEIERANNDVDIVCVYGGGSISMKKYLKSQLQVNCDKADIILFYVPAEFAVILEAQGMFEFTKNEIFEAIKEKYFELKKSSETAIEG